MDFLESTNVSTTLVRGRLVSQVWQGPQWRAEHRLIFHPSPLCAAHFDSIKINPNEVDRINIHEAGLGATIVVNNNWITGGTDMPLPPAAAIDTQEWRMWTNTPPLNEFGYLYVGIYLAGNYARYFPDKWLLDVETSTPLSLAIEELCMLCEWQAPWLTLCELDRTLYVLEA